ncbi:MAG: glutamate--cysteine ligase [Betaproteobacteria bacterium]|nr:glutamate--cysteine ligase [Betaproteobacteria bacterium]
MSVLERLRSLTGDALRGMRRGIEKESLRVRPDGSLAQTLHPAALGSALTHPHITTDFSESQLELITGVQPSVESCLEELTFIHQIVYRHIGEEILWCASMPCSLPSDHLIPIGRYGTANVGRAKTVYRLGLAHRYGRRMQAISGIHYNFSLPGVTSEQYFGLIRNFRRNSWLLLYLFGASPAVCSSFVAGRDHELAPLAPGTHYAPYATSLRMGPLGYQSDAQASLCVSYNNLRDYTASLYEALTVPYAPYEKIGLREDDDYRQLNTTLLQIENEFYSSIRPKRRIKRGERPLHALRERGVEYVEVRLMDLDPFAPIGITAPTCRFLDLFLLHCLLKDSPPDNAREIGEVRRNQQKVALRGREPGLMLERGGRDVRLADWAAEVLGECEPMPALIDRQAGGAAYRSAYEMALSLVRDPESTPSARVLHAMARNHDNSFLRFALIESTAHKSMLQHLELPREVRERFTRLAQESTLQQRELEAADQLDFESFRQRYLSYDQLKV